jgi:hypothetical protein
MNVHGEDTSKKRRYFMNGFKYLGLIALAGICFTVATPKIEAQVSIGISVGRA